MRAAEAPGMSPSRPPLPRHLPAVLAATALLGLGAPTVAHALPRDEPRGQRPPAESRPHERPLAVVLGARGGRTDTAAAPVTGR
jgi:hypothetical protein